MSLPTFKLLNEETAISNKIEKKSEKFLNLRLETKMILEFISKLIKKIISIDK